ncbi:hypothetical protein C8R47DRAFT_1065805 [Mycena vitilis]|nr:hypothetical protein C8R47DRAFT_1065805 [Mycena vitilis]
MPQCTYDIDPSMRRSNVARAAHRRCYIEPNSGEDRRAGALAANSISRSLRMKELGDDYKSLIQRRPVSACGFQERWRFARTSKGHERQPEQGNLRCDKRERLSKETKRFLCGGNRYCALALGRVLGHSIWRTSSLGLTEKVHHRSGIESDLIHQVSGKRRRFSLLEPFAGAFHLSSAIANSMATRNAVIIGAARGIGRAIAVRLASDGCNVVVNDLPSNEAALNSLALWRTCQATNFRPAWLAYQCAARQMIKQGKGDPIIGARSTAAKKGNNTTVLACSKFDMWVEQDTPTSASIPRQSLLSPGSLRPLLRNGDLTILTGLMLGTQLAALANLVDLDSGDLRNAGKTKDLVGLVASEEDGFVISESPASMSLLVNVGTLFNQLIEIKGCQEVGESGSSLNRGPDAQKAQVDVYHLGKIRRKVVARVPL